MNKAGFLPSTGVTLSLDLKQYYEPLRPPITRAPLLRATKVYGQFLGRDFNPLAQLLLLRTPDPVCACKVEEGGAAVNVGSMSSIADENYLNVQRARGDAVVVDVPVWEGLVRDAYRSYNAAIVATIDSGRK